ncbi:MAG: DNA translocase FtsK 4TM domain-containing protein, partial [Gemmataceae bacterium]
MIDRRRWPLYLAACVLLGGGVVLTFRVVASLRAGVAAAAGDSLGLEIAYELRQALGVAVLVFLAGWFAVVVGLVLRRSWLAWSLRTLGWLLLMTSTAVFAERCAALAPWGVMPPLGAGGAIGAWLNEWLRTALQPVGQYLVLGSCLAIGSILS